MIKLRLVAAAVLLLAAPLQAGPLEDGMAAIGRSNFAEARKGFEVGVAAGDPEAAYHLGVMYDRGEGMPIDAAKAVANYRIAAAAGFSFGIHNLAESLRTGSGVTEDMAEARRLFLEAAKLGNASSMHSYATALALGDGGPVDKEQAVFWYGRAIDHESEGTADWMAKLVADGKLPRPDYKRSFKARMAAAQAGDAEAQYQLAMMYFRGQGTKVDPKEMQRWFLAAAEQGHPLAQLRMGNIYKDGFYQTRDLPRANEWFRKASLQENGFAQAILGVGYLGGLGVPKDEVKGYALLVISAYHGDFSALSIRHGRIGARIAEPVVVKAKALAMQCLAQGTAKCGI